MFGTLLLILLIYLGIMALFTGVTMMTAYCLARDRFADPAFSTHFTEDYPPGALPAAWRDFLAISRFYLLYPLGFFMRDPDENLHAHDELPPVLFIHGWTETRATWASYLARFRRNPRRKLFAFTLWPPDAPLEEYAQQLDRKAADVLTRTRHTKLLLVGHSMGGILARDYVRRHGADAVERVITLASPHQGTLWGYVSLGRSVQQMTTRAAYLADLAKDPAIQAVDLHCVASVHDNLVIPFENSLLPGAHHHLVSGYGHVSMTTAPPVMELVESLIYGDPATASHAKPTPAPEPVAVPAAPKQADPTPSKTPSTAQKKEAVPTPKKPAKPRTPSRKAKAPEAAAVTRTAPKKADPDHKEALKRKLAEKLSEG